MYRDGVLLYVKEFHIDLNVLVSSLGPLVEQTMLQREVDIMANII